VARPRSAGGILDKYHLLAYASNPVSAPVAPVTSRNWTVESSRSLLSREPWLEVFEERLRLPDGTPVPDFYTIKLRDYVVIAAVTPDGELVAQTHYRHGAAAVARSIPCGYLEPGETPLEAARRELREETGYAAESWRALGRFVVDGNRGCGWAHVFLAEDAERVAEPVQADLAEIEVELASFADLLRSLGSGEVSELACAAGLGLVAAEVLREAIPSLAGQAR